MHVFKEEFELVNKINKLFVHKPDWISPRFHLLTRWTENCLLPTWFVMSWESMN